MVAASRSTAGRRIFSAFSLFAMCLAALACLAPAVHADGHEEFGTVIGSFFA